MCVRACVETIWRVWFLFRGSGPRVWSAGPPHPLTRDPSSAPAGIMEQTVCQYRTTRLAPTLQLFKSTSLLPDPSRISSRAPLPGPSRGPSCTLCSARNRVALPIYIYLLSMLNAFVAHLVARPVARPAARPVTRPIVWPGPLRDPSPNPLLGLSSVLSSGPSRGPSRTLCAARNRVALPTCTIVLTLDVKCVCGASRRPARRQASRSARCFAHRPTRRPARRPAHCVARPVT